LPAIVWSPLATRIEQQRKQVMQEDSLIQISADCSRQQPNGGVHRLRDPDDFNLPRENQVWSGAA
jgi:hypothetical protein